MKAIRIFNQKEKGKREKKKTNMLYSIWWYICMFKYV